MPPEKPSLNIKEASAYLGIGRTKLYELIGTGELRAYKLGHRTMRIKKSDLDSFLHSRVFDPHK